VEASGVKTVRSEWSRTLMICAKCSKKVGGGFGDGGRKPLAKLLRKELGLKSGRKAPLGIVEVKCLKVCPKGAVTIVDSRDNHAWKIVRAGAAIETVIEELELNGSAPVQHERAMMP
jgi:predicted metal-binding protein